MNRKKAANSISQQYYLMRRHSAQIRAIERVIASLVALMENPRLCLPHAGHISLTFLAHGTDQVPLSLTAAADAAFYERLQNVLSPQEKSAMLLERGFPMQLFAENMRIFPAHGYALCVTVDMPLPLAENDIPVFLRLMAQLLGEKFPQYDACYSADRLLLSPKAF